MDDILSGINGSDEAARAAALEALRSHAGAPEPTEEELLAGTPLREIPPVSSKPARTGHRGPVDGDAKPTKRRSEPAPAPVGESLLEDDPSGTDVVNEIFARLRKATLEERGATALAPKKVAREQARDSRRSPLSPPRRGPRRVSGILTRRVKRALARRSEHHARAHSQREGDDYRRARRRIVQRARYAEAAGDALAQAAQAGVQFARDEGGVAEVSVEPSLVDECAADLAVTIVLALRKRILSESAGDGTERVNAAYREWRGARVERLCTDAARRAFHLGVVTASKGRSIRFFAVPNDAPCDLCAHDSEAGERLAGENFPSGSPYPPLHAGCACTVIPV